MRVQYKYLSKLKFFGKAAFFLLLVFLTVLFRSNDVASAAEEIQIYVIPLPQEGTPPYTSTQVFVLVQSANPIKDMYYVHKSTSNASVVKTGSRMEYIDDDVCLLTLYDSGYYTIYAEDDKGNSTTKIFQISDVDGIAPTYELSKNDFLSRLLSSHVYNLKVWDDHSDVVSLRFKKGFTEDASPEAWERTPELKNSQTVSVVEEGIYTFRAEDSNGNVAVTSRYLGSDELRAVWVSYLEYESKGYTKESFEAEIDAMFDHIAAMNMNAVIVHVRPFSDAMYQSQYFPWSVYASGKQGTDPGFDPLEYMVKAAHSRGLEIHAWLNPYRVTNNTTDYKTLAKDNPARKWLEDKDTVNDRNVIAYAGKLFYNPARQDVQELIINGIAEIVFNYDVDGIHFDDYFYPALGKNYENNFDAKEYKEYAALQTSQGKPVLSIADWRRENVSKLVQQAYLVIKAINPNCVFGISPGGFYRLLTSDTQYYVDYQKWMSMPAYIDYICPQIYWTNGHATYPYEETLDHWLSNVKTNVKVYVGIAAYKAGTKSEEPDWYKNLDVLVDQIKYARNNAVSGFMFFRYDTFVDKANNPAIKRMLEFLQE